LVTGNEIQICGGISMAVIDAEYELITRLTNNMGRSKQDLLNFIGWLDGTDSDEYMLYETYLDEADFEEFMKDYWYGDPDETASYILNWIDYKIGKIDT
jgi:hypothetical protein